MIELVGILNLTPDSFSDGGQYNSVQAALDRAQEMISQGASIIDVGAESSRPGAEAISWQKEVSRLTGFIDRIKNQPWPVSLDSYHPETVDWLSQHLNNFIINDITGFRNPAMRALALKTGNKVIVGHLPAGGPVNSISQVVTELSDSVRLLVETGVSPEKIIVDPGIGFGKTKALNRRLLKFALAMPRHPVMIGYSRKRFLGPGHLGIADNYQAGLIAVGAGARYLRVHDVQGHAGLIGRGPAKASY